MRKEGAWLFFTHTLSLSPPFARYLGDLVFKHWCKASIQLGSDDRKINACRTRNQGIEGLFGQDTMNKLSRLREDFNLKPLKYKESISSVTFYSKVNIRRKLRPKTSKFSSFVDFEHDFAVDESYAGPSLPDDLSSIDSSEQGETRFLLKMFILNSLEKQQSFLLPFLSIVKRLMRATSFFLREVASPCRPATDVSFIVFVLQCS